ncbi:hypothetical protein AAFF_G00176250 [Aldrovandia affinis]|uniref:DDE Tnp4 domain-containing protein n=1 Tax=Aldrovandia affinis TaxID=143900 RepID=A0AAD7W6M4_9TELE|nr:hypothetical protein AAFF_G00176250 [Aldrovandia affinis]
MHVKQQFHKLISQPNFADPPAARREYHRLVQELRLDGERFQRYFRLDRAQFDELLTRVGPRITRLETNWRSPISAAERLAICLVTLQLGTHTGSIAYSYRVGITTVGYIIPEVATAIWECLVSEFMPVPKKEDWMTIAEEFRQHWNFPNCLGSIDGKHVNIQAPSKSGSLYFNYKGTYSIVLLAVVDARYRFRVVDVGAYGRRSDGGTLASSKFGKALQNGRLDLPEDRLLPEAEHLGCQPHVFVADEAFPLQRHLMRPFPGSNLSRRNRVFNYRLSRARMIVENTFGILSAQWRMYRRVIGTSPGNVEKCVKATCVLHNFIRWTAGSPAAERQAPDPVDLQPIRRVGTNNATREAIHVRETLASYFSAEGAVPWQDNVA